MHTHMRMHTHMHMRMHNNTHMRMHMQVLPPHPHALPTIAPPQAGRGSSQPQPLPSKAMIAAAHTDECIGKIAAACKEASPPPPAAGVPSSSERVAPDTPRHAPDTPRHAPGAPRHASGAP